MRETTLHQLSVMDRMNAAVLSLVTREMPRLNRVRKKNLYAASPTFPIPLHLPFDTVTIEGVRIRYACNTSEGKPTLVMLSPFPQSIMAYAPIWKELASRFNLYAFDLPGFGGSEGGIEFMTFKAQGDFLDKIVTHFKLDNAHFLGPDVGMPSLLYYVGHHQNTVKSLLIGDGPAVAPSNNGSAIKKMVYSPFWRTIFLLAGSGAMIAASIRTCYVNYHPNDEEVSDYIASYEGRVGVLLNWFKNYPSSLATVDPLIDTITLPTMVFWGGEDALLHPENGEQIVARMSNASSHVFKDCGHFSYQDRYQEFGTMVTQWIDEQEGLS